MVARVAVGVLAATCSVRSESVARATGPRENLLAGDPTFTLLSVLYVPGLLAVVFLIAWLVWRR